MKPDDVGCLFTKDGTDVWRMVFWVNKPSVCMENLETKRRQSFCVGSSVAEEFKLLEGKHATGTAGTEVEP